MGMSKADILLDAIHCENAGQKIDGWAEELYDIAEKQQAEIDEALDRIWDMSLADDGQAWKEAERFYSKHRDNWGKNKGE